MGQAKKRKHRRKRDNRLYVPTRKIKTGTKPYLSMEEAERLRSFIHAIVEAWQQTDWSFAYWGKLVELSPGTIQRWVDIGLQTKPAAIKEIRKVRGPALITIWRMGLAVAQDVHWVAFEQRQAVLKHYDRSLVLAIEQYRREIKKVAQERKKADQADRRKKMRIIA